jgi:DNA-directed RNA polymerase subunit H (RpoH/RPB5)
MDKLQELRNEILTLKNYGVINKEEEKSLLNKLNAIREQLRIGDVSVSLPSVDDAVIIAVEIAEINNEMTAQEQAFFIAGFSECIKYLEMQSNER